MLQSEEFFRRSIRFNLNRAPFLLVFGNALGEHAFNNCPNGQVLLPGDSPDLCYKVFVTDAREVPDFICGHTIGTAIALPPAPTLADRLLRYICLMLFFCGLLPRVFSEVCYSLIRDGRSIFLLCDSSGLCGVESLLPKIPLKVLSASIIHHLLPAIH